MPGLVWYYLLKADRQINELHRHDYSSVLFNVGRPVGRNGGGVGVRSIFFN